MATTDGKAKSGESVHGSVAKTSKAAPPTLPERSASASACSSTIPPRAALTMRMPGLALASSSAPMSPAVSAVLGRWMVTKSDSATSSSRDTISTPIWLARSGET